MRRSIRKKQEVEKRLIKKIQTEPLISSQHKQFPFLLANFPTSIVLESLSYLQTQEQLKLKCLSKYWHHIIENTPKILETIDLMHNKYLKKLDLSQLVKLIQFTGIRLKNLYLCGNGYERNDLRDDHWDWMNTILKELRKIMITSKNTWQLDVLVIHDKVHILSSMEMNKVKVNKLIFWLESAFPASVHEAYWDKWIVKKAIDKKIVNSLDYINVSGTCSCCQKDFQNGRKCVSCDYFECLKFSCRYTIENRHNSNFVWNYFYKPKHMKMCPKCLKTYCKKCDWVDFKHDQEKNMIICRSCLA